MWTPLVLIALAFAGASSHSCYVSTIESGTIDGLLNRQNKLKDCNDQGKNTLPIPIELPLNREISCFKIDASDPIGNKLELKGCMPKGECNVLNVAIRNRTKLSENGAHLFENSVCYECDGDNCNAAMKNGAEVLFIVLFVFWFY